MAESSVNSDNYDPNADLRNAQNTTNGVNRPMNGTNRQGLIQNNGVFLVTENQHLFKTSSLSLLAITFIIMLGYYVAKFL